MPGLIDNRVHIFLGASSQMALLNPKATFETLEARAAWKAELMLRRGFTAERGMATMMPMAASRSGARRWGERV